MENDLRWKTILDGRKPDKLSLKVTFDGRQPFIKQEQQQESSSYIIIMQPNKERNPIYKSRFYMQKNSSCFSSK